MVEIHAVVIGLVAFAFVAMASFCVIAKSELAIVQDDVEFWKQQYETLNAKVRPAFTDAAENLVPMTASASERLERLKAALDDSKDAAS